MDEVILVMPRRFPHKEYEQVSLDERVELVRRAAAGEPNLSVSITEGGLFLEIAREAPGGVLSAKSLPARQCGW